MVIATEATGIVYGLIDPRYGVVRYVGQTGHTLNYRFRLHIYEAIYSDAKSYKINWIRKLVSLGIQPHPVILAEVPLSNLDATECRFIAALRIEASDIGHTLTNGPNGGTRYGTSGFRWNTEQRARITGRKKTATTCTRISESRKALHLQMSQAQKEQIRAALLGRIVGTETREKLSLAGRGRKHSEETKEYLRKLHLGTKHSLVARAKISAALLGRVFTDVHKERLHRSTELGKAVKAWRNGAVA